MTLIITEHDECFKWDVSKWVWIGTKSANRTEQKCISLSFTSKLLVHFYLRKQIHNIFLSSLHIWCYVVCNHLTAQYMEVLHSSLSEWMWKFIFWSTAFSDFPWNFVAHHNNSGYLKQLLHNLICRYNFFKRLKIWYEKNLWAVSRLDSIMHR